MSSLCLVSSASNAADYFPICHSRREGRGSIDDLSSFDRCSERAFPSRCSQRRLATHQIPQDQTRYRLISLFHPLPSYLYASLLSGYHPLSFLLFFSFLSSFFIQLRFHWQNLQLLYSSDFHSSFLLLHLHLKYVRIARNRGCELKRIDATGRSGGI